MLGESGVALSEGEKQRITIARALLRDAPILILDEPTSALDVETEALVMEAIETPDAGAHHLHHRAPAVDGARCDLILVLRDGTIAERGTLSELLRRNGMFAEYYRTQFAPEHRDRPEPVRNRVIRARWLGVAIIQHLLLRNCREVLKASDRLRYSTASDGRKTTLQVSIAPLQPAHTGIVATVVRLPARRVVL